MDCKKTETMIKLAQCEEYKVCAWGTGYVGTHYGYELLQELGVKIDFYCDSDEAMYGKEIINGIICLNKKNLPSKIICFILTAGHFFAEIISQLTQMGITNYVTYMDLCEYKTQNFFDFQKRKQIAVYTCILGGYDEVSEPEVIEDNCDYYIISDKKPPKNTVFKYINIDDYVEASLVDNTRKNRYCKINAHKIFPKYRYSIYFDGNIELKKGISHYIENLPQTRIAACTKTSYKSVYAEALRCMVHGRDDAKLFLSQLEKYWLEGMPEDFGLLIPCMMIREHNNLICRKMMEEWWEELNMYSKRDMISLSYVLWKNGYSINDVLTLASQSDVLDGDEWLFRRNHGKPRVNCFNKEMDN